MKSFMKKAACLLIAFVTVFTMSSVTTMACSHDAPAAPTFKLCATKMTIAKGASKYLRAKRLSDNTGITWTSSDTAVATVDANGKVTGVAAGTCTITATKDSATATCAVTVKAPTIKLSKTKKSIVVGKKARLYAYVFGASQNVTWSSDNTSVATVSSRGLVKAVAVGTCNISATANGVTVKCAVTVTSAKIKLNKTAKTIKVNHRYRLIAKVKGKSRKVTWTSSDTSVATVNKRGLVKGIKAGTCNITATANGVTAVCQITVQ